MLTNSLSSVMISINRSVKLTLQQYQEKLN